MYEQDNVEDFHREFHLKINFVPCIPEIHESDLRTGLIQEELDELEDAFKKKDVVEVADALGDLLYVVLGCAVTCGIDLEPIFHEIHRSNMTKVGGHKNAAGKLIKPETYEPPKLLPILERQGYKNGIN
jgi:predicted HAD superfamily Cof-like phosphohydrolase